MNAKLSALIVAGLMVVAGQRSTADVIWTIGAVDNSNDEFDLVPHDDPVTVDYYVGDAWTSFPNGLGTDIGDQRSIINIHFSAVLDQPTTLLYRWSAGRSSDEQFRILLDGQYVATSALRSGTDPAVWTTDEFVLPAVIGTDHVLTLEHLSGDGTWNDSLRLVPEPATLGLLMASSLGLLRRRR